MSYKFRNSLRSSELCECNMAALNWCIFRKKSGRLSSTGSEILTFCSHCSANFQPILDCFIPKFKLEYDNLENIKTASVSTVVSNLHQIKRLQFFLGHPVQENIVYKNHYFSFPGWQKLLKLQAFNNLLGSM